jgi:hypothetical protein
VDYRCSVCGKRVAVVHEEGKADPTIIRACGHEGAGVAAGLSATVYSESRMSG